MSEASQDVMNAEIRELIACKTYDESCAVRSRIVGACERGERPKYHWQAVCYVHQARWTVPMLGREQAVEAGGYTGD